MLLDIIQFNGTHYLRCQPSKFMMNSTMLYDIIMRGDQLVVRLHDGHLMVLKGSDMVVELPTATPYEDLSLQEQLFP